MSENLEKIYQSIIDGDKDGTLEQVQQSLAAGIDPGTVLNEGMIAAMKEVGRLFEQGEFFVPEMLIAARAMQAGLKILKPLLVDSGVEPIGKVAIGTVKGDLHDIGKNLVGMMMEGAGFEIIDLGTDVSPEDFVESVRGGATMVGLSALLTTTMPVMEQVIQAISNAGLREQAKVIVGGAPVTSEFAEKIGADGYASDASRAVTLAKSLVE